MRRLLLTWLALCGLVYGVAYADDMSLLGVGTTKTAAVVSGGCSTLIGQVSGIVGCWDADAGVVKSGSNVTTWTDQQSTHYVLGLNTLGGGEAAPTSPVWNATSYGGKAGITCTAASAEYLATNGGSSFSMGGTGASFFMAATMTSNSITYARGLSLGGTGQTGDYNNTTSVAAFIRNATSQQMIWYYNSTAATAYNITYATASRFGLVFDGTNGNQYLNNSLQNQNSQASLALTTGQLGMCDGVGSTGAYWDGVIRRIVITNTTASSTDRGFIDTFLSN